jgi:hypothetical protein
VAPAAAGLRPVAESIARTMSQRRTSYTNPRSPTIPVQAYRTPVPTGIIGGYAAQVVPASGSVTIRCGPQGTGTIWYPQAVAISTTTGANDTSTCALYLSPLPNGSVVVTTQIGGQSYAGGGDTIGVAVPPMWPGYFIIAVWSGATVGDLAALQVYGSQTTLTV